MSASILDCIIIRLSSSSSSGTATIAGATTREKDHHEFFPVAVGIGRSVVQNKRQEGVSLKTLSERTLLMVMQVGK